MEFAMEHIVKHTPEVSQLEDSRLEGQPSPQLLLCTHILGNAVQGQPLSAATQQEPRSSAWASIQLQGGVKSLRELHTE